MLDTPQPVPVLTYAFQRGHRDDLESSAATTLLNKMRAVAAGGGALLADATSVKATLPLP